MLLFSPQQLGLCDRLHGRIALADLFALVAWFLLYFHDIRIAALSVGVVPSLSIPNISFVYPIGDKYPVDFVIVWMLKNHAPSNDTSAIALVPSSVSRIQIYWYLFVGIVVPAAGDPLFTFVFKIIPILDRIGCMNTACAFVPFDHPNIETVF